MILGIFSQFSNFSGINPALAENPIFYILMFQGPKISPNDLKIYGDQFLEGRRLGSEGSEQAEARGPKEGGPHGQGIWPRGHPLLGLRPPLVCFLRSQVFFLPKLMLVNFQVIWTSFGFLKHQNIENRVFCQCRVNSRKIGKL